MADKPLKSQKSLKSPFNFDEEPTASRFRKNYFPEQL